MGGSIGRKYKDLVMDKDFIEGATSRTNPRKGPVWEAQVDTNAVQYFMTDTQVKSDRHAGSSVTWKDERQGKSEEDSICSLKLVTGILMQGSHYNPFPDITGRPENHHFLTTILVDGAT